MQPARGMSGHPSPIKTDRASAFPRSSYSLAPSLRLLGLSVSLPGTLPLDLATDLMSSVPAPSHSIPQQFYVAGSPVTLFRRMGEVTPLTP